MGSLRVVVADKLGDYRSEMALVEDDELVQALSA